MAGSSAREREGLERWHGEFGKFLVLMRFDHMRINMPEIGAHLRRWSFHVFPDRKELVWFIVYTE
jgi:hypothetical protein